MEFSVSYVMSIFNVCDIFFGIIVCDIGSYAEDNTPNNFDVNLDHVNKQFRKI